MQQAVFARQQIDQGTKVKDLGDGAFIDLANFHFSRDLGNAALGLFGFGAIGGGNGDRAILIDVDLGTGFFGQSADHRPTLANHVADFFRVDLHGEEFGRKVAHLGACLAHGLLHLAQNMDTGLFGLGQSDLHDFLGNALNFDVHLQGGDALGAAGDLEVHVAQVVLVTQNVGQDGKAIAFFDQTHGDACHVGLERHTCVHQGQATATHRRHGRRAIGLGDFGHHTHGVRELFFGRQHRCQSTLGQSAMADFTALGRTHAAHFARGKGRHVVVQHEAVFKLASQSVNALGIALGTQSGNHQSLGFTAGEQGRAMGAGQHRIADFNRAHGAGVAAIDARLASQNLATNNARLDLEQQVVHLDGVESHATGGQAIFSGLVSLAASLRTGLLVADLIGRNELVLRMGGQLGFEVGVTGGGRPVPCGFAGIANQFVDGIDGDLALVVAKNHGT